MRSRRTTSRARPRAVLERLSAAIRDSGDDTPSDPGIGACGAAAQGTWCAGDLSGAVLTPAGGRSAPGRRRRSRSSRRRRRSPRASSPGRSRSRCRSPVSRGRPAAPVAATVASSSPTGTLSTSPAGPFTPTVGVRAARRSVLHRPALLPGSDGGHRDADGVGRGSWPRTQQLTVGGAAPVSLRIEPSVSTLFTGGTVALRAVGIDAFGNATPTAALWTASPDGIGTLSSAVGRDDDVHRGHHRPALHR